MASDLGFVEYVCDQAGLPGRLAFRKMFGEYALYLDGKVVALVCNNHLFVKPTPESRALLPTVGEQPPYPRGKPHLRIGAELDDRDALRRLLLVTAEALPPPVPRRAALRAAKKSPPSRGKS